MKTHTFIILLSLALSAQAQKKGIVLHYDFKKTHDTQVTDRGPSHIYAQLKNGAYVQDGCLVLETKEAYLDMTPGVGTIVNQLTDFTIYTRYYVSPNTKIRGNGYFLWCFSALEANKEKDGPYQAYRVNEQRCETSIGGWSQETGIQMSNPTEQGKWVNVIFRQASGKGELFIDGKLVGTEQGFPELRTIFTTPTQYNWLGRPPFNGDNYITGTQISDFRIYNRALSDKELRKLLKQSK